MEKNIKIKALVSNWNKVKDFLMKSFANFNLNNKQKHDICLACEEIYVNISKYAYPKGEGYVWISVEKDDSSKDIIITFEDQGVKFNPLSVRDPKISGSAVERKIGGLGIFMVKKIMDQVEYKYERGKNKLKLTKNSLR